MFRLVNRWGNVFKDVKTEREKAELEKQGYKVVSATTNGQTDIDKMTVEQLDNFAKEKNIDLHNCKNKAEKVETIKKALAENN